MMIEMIKMNTYLQIRVQVQTKFKLKTQIEIPKRQQIYIDIFSHIT